MLFKYNGKREPAEPGTYEVEVYLPDVDNNEIEKRQVATKFPIILFN